MQLDIISPVKAMTSLSEMKQTDWVSMLVNKRRNADVDERHGEQGNVVAGVV